jgi:hypothetical protein
MRWEVLDAWKALFHETTMGNDLDDREGRN